MGSAELFPTALRAGETQLLPIFFDSTAEGTIDLFPTGSNVCCPEPLVFAASQVEIESTRITGTGNARVLHAAGELLNTAGQDLSHVRVLAYVDGAPQTRVEATVACTAGVVARGDAAAVTLALPVSSGEANPRIHVLGIEASPTNTLIGMPVRDVSFSQVSPSHDGLVTVFISATLHNPTSSWMLLRGDCAALRDARGKIVGAAPMPIDSSDAPLIRPGASVKITGVTVAIAPISTAGVTAYGEETMGPVACCAP